MLLFPAEGPQNNDLRLKHWPGGGATNYEHTDPLCIGSIQEV